jgi:hypothetical protein
MLAALLSAEELGLSIELCSSSVLSQPIFVLVLILDVNSLRPMRYQQSARSLLLVLGFRTDDPDCVFGRGQFAIVPSSVDLCKLSAEKKYLRRVVHPK